MKTLTIINTSGGRGKTATVKKLTELLTGIHAKRVLLIDLDFLVSSNLSSHFVSSPQRLASLPTIIEAMGDPLVRPHPVSPTIGLFVGNETLRQAEQWFGGQEKPVLVLRNYLQSSPVAQEFDYCLIDSCSGWNLSAQNAVAAAQYALVPRTV